MPASIKVTQEINPELGSQLIAIDGKAMRHRFDRTTEASHLHLLTAYALSEWLESRAARGK